MPEDLELLRRYAYDRSESAFAELVGRRVNFVYSAAFRQVGGDSQLAEEVTQAVFTELARRAEALGSHPRLGGWLYRTTRFKAIDAARAKQRRLAREQETPTMDDFPSDAEAGADWVPLRSLLDEAVSALSETDREAVLLRFFESASYGEVGTQLQLSENAARMRVDRALDKLRAILAKRGFVSTAAALALTLANQAVRAAPADVSARIASASLAAAATGSSALNLLQFMSTAKLKVGIVSALLLGGAATVAVQYRTHLHETAQLEQQGRELAQLRQENSLFKQSSTAAPSAGISGATPVAPKAAAVSRGGPKVPLAAGLTPILSLKNAGRATPRDAFQTQMWAARNGDIALTASALTFGPTARARMEELVAQLPDSVRSTYNTPELLMAFVLAGSPHPVGGMTVLGETQEDANNVILQTEWQHEDDDVVHQTNAHLQLSDGSWRLVVPVVLVDVAQRYLLHNPPE
jgi:RNA polymerase sigma factor (sigma-70 family)